MEFRHPDHKKASVRSAGVISHCEMTPAAWREQFTTALRGSANLCIDYASAQLD